MRSWISDPAEIRARLEEQARTEGFSALGICAPDANPQLPERLAAFLKADAFHINRLALVWDAMLRLLNRAEAVDILTVAEELRDAQ